MWATTAFVMPLTFTVYWICCPLIVRVAVPVAGVVTGGTSLAPDSSAVKLVAGLDGSSLQADTTGSRTPAAIVRTRKLCIGASWVCLAR